MIAVANLPRPTLRERRWIDSMRRLGCKVVMADDEWIDNRRNMVCPPSYRLASAADIRIGDKMAFGTPDRWRVVRITGDYPRAFFNGEKYWKFDPVPFACGGVR